MSTRDLLIVLLALITLAIPAAASLRYDGRYCRGEGDQQYLRLIDESFGYFHPNPNTPNISMLYRADWDCLSEGPAWGMWWIQNSYGPTFCSLPFLQDPWLTALQHSQDFWFNHQGDGKTMGNHATVIAPVGSLCDCAGRDTVIYVQGDGNWKIHDWCYGFTSAGVLMQAELLLIGRDMDAIKRYLPKLEKACDFIEARRDPKNGLFLVGPAANLLAPSYGGVRMPDGTFGKAYLSEITITYLAALERMVELYKLTGDTAKQSEYEARAQKNRDSIPQLLTPEGYFVRSIDPDGTKHGVYGEARYGTFETAPNVDAVCHRAVDDATAGKIFGKIVSIPQLRPNDYLITNYPSLDDTYVNWGSGDLPSIWKYGMWVNGGVWTTMEARAIMAYYRLGRYEDIRRSALRSRAFAIDYQYDAPLKDFGKTVWFDSKLTNICYDSLGVPAATIRGLFEYNYLADRLVLRPHIPPSIKSYMQVEPIRFGSKRISISVTNSGPIVGSAKVNGRALALQGKDRVDLLYDALPDQANVEIKMTGGWPASNEPPAAVETPKPVRAVAALPRDLESKYQTLLQYRDQLAGESGRDSQKAFTAAAIAAFDSWRERADIHYAGSGMNRKKQAAVLRMYRDAATAMYNGASEMMRQTK